MKRNNTQSISEVLREYINKNQFDSKLKERSIINSWESIIGKSVANATDRIYIKDGVMFVYFKSAVVRNEIMMIRSALLEKINEAAGENFIRGIVLK